MDIKSFSTQCAHYLSSPKSSALITLLLLCLAAYQLANITWLLIPSKSQSFSWVPQQVNAVKSSAQVDLSRLTALNLFGEYQAKPQAKSVATTSTTEAPKTSLKLTLSGLVASSDQSKALAIVEHKGKQQTYGVEESINGTKAVIKEIQIDRIILLHRGVYESLLLDPDDKSSKSSSASNNRKKTSAKSKSAVASSKVNVKEVLNDPSKLTDYIRISPVRKDGTLTGYRVNPGKNAGLFKQVGLKANDLAVALNGYDLRDNAQAMQVMQEMAELTDITVTVERNGQLQDVFFSLPDE
ncbi:type II secretion system protein GspC [Agarivorans sp. MS3-6]|uniref:type II secretion system protein GspC n=1 Tax=Agarivorans sp. TSD2052 TaxID=2937286 RepID=UPI00200CBE1B|nr:type II secretion system protein GspC [Agarivorans sp. TSD2052]UPW18253.1 type II secretion system protein GspC [Agarivorans sp. TSD2052]